MLTIQVSNKREQEIVNLHLEKIKLEGNLEEINRALCYVPREFYQDRKSRVLRRLDQIESILENKPIAIQPNDEIQQFFITTAE